MVNSLKRLKKLKYQTIMVWLAPIDSVNIFN